MLEKIDELVTTRGKGKEVTLKEIIGIYDDVVKNHRRTKSNCTSKQAQNYVSAYRKLKATLEVTTLTLGRMNTYPNESYFIEQNQP